MTYGQRFKTLRDKLKAVQPDLTVLKIAARLDSPYPATVYTIERSWRIPALPTIERHARALGCQPWELLEDVETEFDMARALGKLSPTAATTGWASLMTKYLVKKRQASAKKKRIETSGNAVSRSPTQQVQPDEATAAISRVKRVIASAEARGGKSSVRRGRAESPKRSNP